MAAVREPETQPQPQSQSQPQPQLESEAQSQTPSSSLHDHPSFNIKRDRSKRKSTEGWDSHRGLCQRRRNSKDPFTRLSSTSASTPLPTTTSLLATNLMHDSKLNADEYDMHMHIDMDAAVTVSRETTDIESCDNSDSGSVVEISKPIGIGIGTGTVVTATHGTSRREDTDVVDTSTGLVLFGGVGYWYYRQRESEAASIQSKSMALVLPNEEHQQQYHRFHPGQGSSRN